MNTMKICYCVFIFIALFYSICPSSKWILELGDNFVDVHRDGGYWLVKFYTPWCGKCKRLEPAWAHVVQALKNTHIRVGRVDCTAFPNIGNMFGVTRYPVIKLISGDEQHTFTGDKNTEEIVNFAVRMSGPPVEQITRPESLANIKNMNQLFFMYVGGKDDALWDTFYGVAKDLQAYAFYYSTSENIAKKYINIHKVPAIFVHKENSHYFYSVDMSNEQTKPEHVNNSMHKWINEERFESFPKITDGNIDQVLQTRKYIVMVVVEENKLMQIPKEMLEFRSLIENLIRVKRHKYHRNFQFGWTSNLELANNIAMEILPVPFLLVLNSTTFHHYLPEDDPTEMTSDAIEGFLDRVYNQNTQIYGGNDLAVNIYRSYFKARTTLADRWRGNHVLTTVLLGLPLAFFSLLLYTCCCSDILDAEEDEEEPHEKRD